MSVIRVVYENVPPFPATDQHPEAVRYQVGAFWVDAIGGAPTLEEVLAILNKTVPDLSDLENLERTLKAIALLMRDYGNQLKAEVRGLAVLLVGKGVITAQEAGQLLAYAGSGAGNQKTVADLRADFAAKYISIDGSPPAA